MAYNWAFGHFNAGNNLMQKKQYRAAIVKYTMGIELFPNDQLVFVYLAGAFAMAGEFSISLELANCVDIGKAKPETKVEIAERLQRTRHFISSQTSHT